MKIASRISTAAIALFSTLALAAEPTPPVTLKTDGKNTVVLSNGLVSATIDTAGASMKKYTYRGFDLLSAGYFSMDGGTNYRTPANCRYSVKVQTPDTVDIAMKRAWSNEPQAFDIDVHYVLRRGDTGIYVYALLDHPAAYPVGGYGEWRYVWKLPDDTLEHIFTDDQRQWAMANSKDKRETTGIKEITKLLTGVRAGQFDCKYDYSVSYYDNGTWGHASDKNKVGAFMVLGSQEFFNDGPTKQDLNAAAGINHIHFGMNHYNGSNVSVPNGTAWQKMFGPFLLYVNHADTAQACWQDAKAQVAKERQAWPYAWLTNNPAYPTKAQRGTVTGTFAVSDPLKPKVTGAGAWIGLAAPEPGKNWQFDSMNYQFWTHVSDAGTFNIPNIRPGKYTLYAFTIGEVGEFSRADIDVRPGQSLDLGKITWTPPHKGTSIAWEIGTPDRTAKEFRHGDDYFHGYVWQNYTKEFPNPIEYTIGKSDPAKDWNYAQTIYGDSGKPNVWNVHFNLDRAPAGDASLTFAIASAQHGSAHVALNGTKLEDLNPSVQGGNALLRESIHAKYCVEYITVPRSAMRAGANTLSLTFGTTNPKSADAHIMYDYIAMELP
jgi:rhamnogalacturonan endolyase